MSPGLGLWQHGMKIGLIAGGVAVLLSLIGMVEAFSQRFIISEGITLGQTLLLSVSLFVSYQAAKKTPGPGAFGRLLNGVFAGLTAAGRPRSFHLPGRPPESAQDLYQRLPAPL